MSRSPTSTTRSPTLAPETRDPRLDTAKGVLIVLVVLGHLLEAIDPWQEGAARVPLTLIYAFHMPAFVFLAGVTASTSHGWRRRAATSLLLLVVFQCVHFVGWTAIESGKSFSWGEPFWLLWFLLAMTWWQALAPLVVRAPRTGIALSVAIALAVGLFPWIGAPLALSRTLVLLPFFVLGVTHGKALVAFAGALPGSRRLVLTALAASALTLVVVADPGRGWLYASSGYAVMGVEPAEGVATRAALLGVAALVAFTLLAWLPPRAVIGLTTAGRRSLGIYLLHGLPVMMLTPVLAGTMDRHGAAAAWTLGVTVLGGIVTLLAVPGPDRLLRTGAAAVVDRTLPAAPPPVPAPAASVRAARTEDERKATAT